MCVFYVYLTLFTDYNYYYDVLKLRNPRIETSDILLVILLVYHHFHRTDGESVFAYKNALASVV